MLFPGFISQCLASVPEGSQRWHLCIKVYEGYSLHKESAIVKIHVASLFLPELLSLPLLISSVIHCSVPFEMHQIVAVK